MTQAKHLATFAVKAACILLAGAFTVASGIGIALIMVGVL